VAKAGDVIENPITGERITFLKTTQETDGKMLRFEYVVPPRFSIPEHVHPYQGERHEVLSGTLWGRVGGQERDYTQGERVVGPAGVPHAWQNPSSEEELRFVSELRPPLVFETILRPPSASRGMARPPSRAYPRTRCSLRCWWTRPGGCSTPVGYRWPCRKRS
jgi:quercetin dioxygenase-like cupin family protein